MPVLDAETPLAQNIRSLAKGDAGSIKDFMRGRSDTYKINPFDIVVEPGFNARDIDSPETQEHIDGLAKSISAIGLQRALKVRMKGNRPVLLDGECRLRAIKRAIEQYGAEIRTVDCRLADKAMSDADAVLSLVVENSGKDLNALEKASVFKRLRAYGWTDVEIAERSGLSEVRVGQLVELAAVPEELKAMVRSNEIAPTTAWTIAKNNDFDTARTIAAVSEAREAAGQNGRKRVTARFVKGTKTSLRKSLGEILSGCSVEDMDEDGFLVVFSREQFEELRALAKVEMKIISAFA